MRLWKGLMPIWALAVFAFGAYLWIHTGAEAQSAGQGWRAVPTSGSGSGTIEGLRDSVSDIVSDSAATMNEIGTALSGAPSTVSAANLTALTDGSTTALHNHTGGDTVGVDSLLQVNGNLYRPEQAFVQTVEGFTGWGAGTSYGLECFQVYDGSLYASIDKTSPGGPIWGKTGAGDWALFYTPPGGRGAQSMGVFRGRLFAGWTTGASGGGDIAMWDKSSWTTVMDSTFEEVWDFVVYGNRLYAGVGDGSNEGTVVYTENGTNWYPSLSGYDTGLFVTRSLAKHNGKLYAGISDAAYEGTAYLYEFDGTTWTNLGAIAASKDIYSMASYNGKLFIGMGAGVSEADIYTWDGQQFELFVDQTGTDKREISEMQVYNGKLYVGVDGPGAGDGQIHYIDGDRWLFTPVMGSGTQEAWGAFAVYNERFFAGTDGGGGAADIWEYYSGTRDGPAAPTLGESVHNFAKKVTMADSLLAQNLYLDSGHLGIGIVPTANNWAYLYDAALSSDASVRGLFVNLTRTAGTTDESDVFYGVQNTPEVAFSGGETVGHFYAAYNRARLTSGDIGTYAATRSLWGAFNNADLDGGVVTGDVYGAQWNVDIEAASRVDGNIYGAYVQVDDDDNSGTGAYGIYIDDLSNVDYAIYQAGVAPNYFAGQVGIGEDNPIDELDVTGSEAESFVGFRITNEAVSHVDNSVRFNSLLNTSTSKRAAVTQTISFSDVTDATRTSLWTVGTANSGSFATAMALKGNKLGVGTESPTVLLTVSSSGASALSTGGSVLIDVDGTIGASDAHLAIRNGATWSTYNAGEADWTVSSDSTMKTSLDTINAVKLNKLRSIFEDSLHVWRYKWKPETLESSERIEAIWADTLKIAKLVAQEVARRQEVVLRDSVINDSVSVKIYYVVDEEERAAIRSKIDMEVWANIDAQLDADSVRVAKGAAKRHVGLIAQEAASITRLLAPEELQEGSVNHSHVQAAMMQMVIDLSRRVKALEARVEALENP